jgi:lycopene cyclase domain-containing protein
MRHLAYLGVLLGCLAAALWLEPVLKVNVLRRWRRLLLTLLPVVAVFVAWDVAAIAAGQWTFDSAQVTGIRLPGDLPLDEVLFFVVVPVCAILGFEAVRAVLGRPAGDEPPEPAPHAGEAPPVGAPPGGDGFGPVGGDP